MEKNTFDRSDLQQICSYILFREGTTTQTGSYEERLDQAKRLAYSELKSISNEKLDEAAVQEILSVAFGTYEAVCTEIGMKLGARLILQLLGEDNI